MINHSNDIERGFRSDMSTDFLIGCYCIDENGHTGFTDLRGGEGERLEDENENNLEKTAEYQGAPLTLGEFYQFDWHIEGNDSDYRIICDGNVKPVDREALLNRMLAAKLDLKAGVRKQFADFQKTLLDEVTGAPHTYIYELLQNANDYPYNGEPVTVKFILTDNYLFFLHSGESFNLKNIVAISAANDGEKRDNTDTIGYKGIGFKSVFVKNNYVYLRSGGWSVRFDEEEIRRRSNNRKKAWTLMPIPTKEEELDDEIKQVLSSIPSDMRVQFALHHKNDARENIPNLEKVFCDNQILVFIPHVDQASVEIDGEEKFKVSKDRERWAIFEDTVDVTDDLRNEIEELIKNNERVPQKFQKINKIKISLAVTRENGKIKPIEDAKVYNYLPTERRMGMKFLVNADFLPNGSRSDLHPAKWNEYVMEQCGVKFAEWWASFLAKEDEYDLSSVFNILPDINNTDPFGKYFIAGFKKRIAEIPCVPVLRDGDYSVLKIQDVIEDITGLTSSKRDVMSDEEFYAVTGYKESLPHPLIRNHKNLSILFGRSSHRTFQKSDLQYIISSFKHASETDSFAIYLRDRQKNIRFLDFLLSYGNIISEASSYPIFLCSDGNLNYANQVYYDIDDYLTDLNKFEDQLIRLDHDVLYYLEDNRNWSGYSGRFKKFDAGSVALQLNLLLSNEGFDGRITNQEDSIHYIHFLACHAKNVKFPTSYPFYSEDSEVEKCTTSLFQKNDLGIDLVAKAWLDSGRVRFINEEYFYFDEDDVKRYLECYGIPELYNNTVLDVIVNKDTIESLNQTLQDESNNSDFFEFLSDISTDGFTIQFAKLDKEIRDKIPVIATDGERNIFLPSTTHLYNYDDDWYAFLDNAWLPTGIMLALSDAYPDAVFPQEAKDSFKAFFNSIGICEHFTVRKALENEIKSHWDEIVKNITASDISYELLDFLFEHKDDVKNLGLNKLKEIPVPLKDKDNMFSLNEILGNGETPYQCSFEVNTLYDQSWFVSSLLTVVSDDFNQLFDGNDRREFFASVGFEIFDLKTYIKKCLLPDLDKVIYQEEINDFKKNIDFHHFFASLYSEDGLGADTLNKLKEQPIFIAKPGEDDCQSEMAKSSTDHVLPSEKLNNIVRDDIIPIEILQAIHEDYFLTDRDTITEYFKQLGNAEMKDAEIFEFVRQHREKIAPYILDQERNIRFWYWAQQEAGKYEDREKLRGFSMLDADGNFCKPSELYISSAYTSDPSAERIIRTFVGTDNVKFISDDYLKANEDSAKWLDLFKSLGVNITAYYILIKKVLSRIYEYEKLDVVYAFADILDRIEAEDQVKKESIIESLSYMRVICNDGHYHPIKEVVISGDYLEAGSNKYAAVRLPLHVSDVYLTELENELVRKTRVLNFFKFLADNEVCKESLRTAETLVKRRINYFMEHQLLYKEPDKHFTIIGELAKDYYNNPNWFSKDLLADELFVYLKDADRLISTKGTIYLGSVYNPNCDYEANGCNNLNYISDEYALSGIENVKSLFAYYNIRSAFAARPLELDLLAQERFARYFWNNFLPSHRNDPLFLTRVVEKKNFENRPCIPTASGEVKRPYELYLCDDEHKELRDIVERMGKKDSALPDVVLPPDWDLGLRDQLSFLDCLEYLLMNEDGLLKHRLLVYKWMAFTSDEEIRKYQRYIDRYKEIAKWKTGKPDWKPLKELHVLIWENSTGLLKGLFGASEFVCGNMPEEQYVHERLCDILGLKPLSDNDFDHQGVGNPDPEASAEIEKRLLYLSYLECKDNKEDWKELFESRRKQLSKISIKTCTKIPYYFPEADGSRNLSTDILVYTESPDELLYVGKWNGMMFMSIVKWVVKTFNINDGFKEPFLQKLFGTPFNQYLIENGGELPKEFISCLSANDQEGLTEEIEEPESPEYVRPENLWLKPMDKEPASEGQTPNVPQQHDGEHNQEPASSPEGNKFHPAEVDTQNDRGTSENELDKTRPEHPNMGGGSNETPVNPSTPSAPYTENRPNNQANDNNDSSAEDDRTYEERALDRWKEEAEKTITPPTSSQPPYIIPEETYNPEERTNHEPSRGDMFDKDADIPKRPESTIANRNGAKRQATIAKNEAREAADRESRREKMNEYPEYSLQWFVHRLDALIEDQAAMSSHEIKIDFWDWALMDESKLLYRLVGPSRPIPYTFADYSKQEVYILDKKGEHRINAHVVEADDSGVDLVCSSKLPENNSERRIRIKATSNSGFVDALNTRFKKLYFGYENTTIRLTDELPDNISFIYGPPGTGKTTEVVNRICNLVDLNDDVKILVLTPTNRAADEVAERLCKRLDLNANVSRYGVTESDDLVENHFESLKNRTTMFLAEDSSDVVVTTIARYPYDSMNNGIPIFDLKWDAIIVDEASMIDVVPITLLLINNKADKFIIAGDPMQIKPVTPENVTERNIYDMVGLSSFKKAIEGKCKYPVDILDTQHRSVSIIGNMVSQFAYDGKLKNDINRQPQKVLQLPGLQVSTVNTIGYSVEEMGLLYGFNPVEKSSVHIYSAVFAYEFAKYIANTVKVSHSDIDYTIGIVSPYGKQADAIKQMLEASPIDTSNCKVKCGTVHKFQGGECDIMIVVMNYPSTNSGWNANINKQNIMNVAMSRAKDYVFFLMPLVPLENSKDKKPTYLMSNWLAKVLPDNFQKSYAHEIEKTIFNNMSYIQENTSIRCHLPVNVSSGMSKRYEIRLSDTALDIQLNNDK